MITYQILRDRKPPSEFFIDPSIDSSREDPASDYPQWLLLEQFKCPCCTLSSKERKTCPAALSVKSLAETFSQNMSFETVTTVVKRDEVEYRATISIQQALRSVSGLLFALSSCPVLCRLRPLAQHHIPFGTPSQTVTRFIGYYLISQYLRKQEGLTPDWELTGLLSFLDDLHEVNTQLAQRLRLASDVDALLNSIVILDMGARITESDIQDHLLELKPLYEMYLKD